MSGGDDRFDLAVIGGGPAGAATAIGAARAGLAVVLFEKSRPPVRKVCGEFLSEPGAELFRRLTGDDLSGAPRLTSALFRELGGRGAAAFRLDPVAFGVTRARLDEALLAAAGRAGVAVRRGVRVAGRLPEGEGWRLSGRDGDDDPAHGLARATRLVVADGRPVARGAGRWVGLKSYAPAHAAEADLEIRLRGGDGYLGLSPVEGGRWSVAGLHRAGRPPLPGLSAMTPHAGTPPFRLGWHPPDDPRLFRVGDALASWPPLLGDGLTAALSGGLALGAALGSRRFAPPEWERQWRAGQGTALRRALRLHALLVSPAARHLLFTAAGWWPGLAFRLARRVRISGGGSASRTRPAAAP